MAIDPNTGLIQLAPPPVPGGVTTGSVNQAPAAPAPSTPPTTTEAPVAPQPVDPIKSYTAAQGSAATAGATGYTPTPYNVDQTKGTVAGQLDSLLKSESPYLQLARTNARLGMNERGLINSSIALSAGEQAAIASALPIAQADAGAYNQAMTNTANAQNAASAAAATAANNASSTNAQLLTSMNATNANAVNQALSAEAQASNQRALQVISSNTQAQLAVLQSQNQQLLQTNVNAANGFSQVVQAIANISTNPNLDGNAKAAAIASQINMLNQLLKTTAAISSTNQNLVEQLNLDQYFNNPQGLTGTAPSAAVYPGANGQYYQSQAEANQSYVEAGRQQAITEQQAQQQQQQVYY